MAKALHRVQVRLERFTIALQIRLGKGNPPFALVLDIIEPTATKEPGGIEFRRSEHMHRLDLVAPGFKKNQRFLILRRLSEEIRHNDRDSGLLGLLDISTNGLAQIRLPRCLEPFQERATRRNWLRWRRDDKARKGRWPFSGEDSATTRKVSLLISTT